MRMGSPTGAEMMRPAVVSTRQVALEHLGQPRQRQHPGKRLGERKHRSISNFMLTPTGLLWKPPPPPKAAAGRLMPDRLGRVTGTSSPNDGCSQIQQASRMITRKLATILTGCYLALAASAVAYELSIRIYDRGNSEFAGMLSMAVTLPASLLLVLMGKAAFSVNVGDSDLSFFVILGLSALANACVIWMILVMLSRQK